MGEGLQFSFLRKGSRITPLQTGPFSNVDNKFTFHYLLASTGTAFLKVSLTKPVVEKGDYFEVWVEDYSPKLEVEGFRGVFCGYKQSTSDFTALTKWNFFGSPDSIVPLTRLTPEFTGRVTVRNVTIMRISKASFADEGREFYCQLDYHNSTATPQELDIVQIVKVETVYGKQNIKIFTKYFVSGSFSQNTINSS